MLYEKTTTPRRAAAFVAGLMTLALVGTITIAPVSSAQAQTSSYQTARHVFPWAQQWPNHTSGYYADDSDYFYNHRDHRDHRE